MTCENNVEMYADCYGRSDRMLDPSCGRFDSFIARDGDRGSIPRTSCSHGYQVDASTRDKRIYHADLLASVQLPTSCLYSSKEE
jgi:hypothetical protein